MFFILKIIPEWLCWLLLIAGLFGYLCSHLIPIKTYALLLKNLGLATILVVIFIFGMHYSDSVWQSKTAELEAKVVLAETKAAIANTEIQTKTVTKINTVKEIVYVNKELLEKTASKQIDANCTLPVSSIVLHNSASQAQVARGPSSLDGTPSGVEASQLLGTVVDNYGTCYENAIKLQAWQDWYRTQKQIYEEVK